MASVSQNIKIRDIDQLREELKGWETEPVQLSPGSLDLVLSTAEVGTCALLQLSVGPRIADRSAVHAGYVGFVLAERPQTWCGMEIKPPTLLIMRPGREMRSILLPGFRSLEFYLKESDLLGHPLGKMLCHNRLDPERSVVPLNNLMATRLRNVANLVFSDSGTPGGVSDAMIVKEATQNRILDLLESIIRLHFDISPSTHDGKRKQPRNSILAIAALEKIERFDPTSVSVADLCDRLGVSRRSLELSFANTLGVSPGQYLLAYRLNSARRNLVATGGPVSESASLAGFQDGSRFSYQYRRLFGELPSQTLARRLGRRREN